MGYNEADTRAKLIDPALYTCGWTEEHIKREETPGQIIIVGIHARRRAGRIDYTLRLKISEDAQPVAIGLIEAKSEDYPAGHGLEQAKSYAYAERFHVPFVYASNGHQFVEFDATTGKTSQARSMDQFPTPEMLRIRYEMAQGFKLDDESAKPLLTRYSKGAEAGRRYYQDAAIRAALEKIATGDNRVLLTLATGAGKTFIAVNLLKRISDAGHMRQALFLCDRDELRTQASGAFQSMFGNDAAIVSSGKPQKNARVLVATYQTLDVDTDDASSTFLRDNYPEDYFSHIIIDECHRSAWGKWSEIFKRNPNAVQIGLTATPRQLTEDAEDNSDAKADMQISADNLKHFGEPVYEYDIAQGIDDGYLAACEIIRADVDIDETGLTIEEVMYYSPVNAITGEAITEEDLQELYKNTDYEKQIMLPDRVYAMCKDLFNHLLDYNDGNPHQKTIIFCARDTHADAVADTLGNIYAGWCHQNGIMPKNYFAFKATAASKGTQYLPDLRGSSQSHFIATTVELLTTGVDVPRVENIAFFRYMNSPISFYQMIGRGTRIFAPNNKLMFRVYDYTNATRLFGQEFITKLTGKRESSGTGTGESDKIPPITISGVEVHVTEAGRYILDENGEPITIEAYLEQLAERLLGEAETIGAFRKIWIDPIERLALLNNLPDSGRSVHVIQHLQDMDDYDLYDVLAEIGYGLDAKTMQERAEAFDYKHASWLASLPPQTAATLRAIATQFASNGIAALESRELFKIPAVRQAGGIKALQMIGANDALRQTKERIYAA